MCNTYYERIYLYIALGNNSFQHTMESVLEHGQRYSKEMYFKYITPVTLAAFHATIKILKILYYPHVCGFKHVKQIVCCFRILSKDARYSIFRHILSKFNRAKQIK